MQKKEWSKFYTDVNIKEKVLKWPNEMMVITLFGVKPFALNFDQSCKVLDIGCGSGNNLLPFLDAGCDGYGIEIESGILEIAKSYLESRGYSAEFKVGHNREIPFENNSFDLIISINVLHYEPTEELISSALDEYYQKLKPGGILYLSTTGPEHMVYKAAESLGKHQYRFGYNDFRKGEKFFYFDDQQHLKEQLSKKFSSVKIGSCNMAMLNDQQDYLIAVAQK